MAKFLDGAPCVEAGVASFALGAVGVVAGVLVKRHGLGEMRSAHDIAAATAVVLAEVPCEVGLANSACIGRLVGLPVCHSWRSSYFAIFLIDAVAGHSAEALAKEIEFRLLRRHI